MLRVSASLMVANVCWCFSGCSDLRSLPDPGILSDASIHDGDADGSSGSGGGSQSDDGSADAPGTRTGGGGCVDGSPCMVMSLPCLVGSTVCTGGGTKCTPTDKKQANGTVCGPDSVCLDGACSGCASGTSCALAGKPCRSGLIDCAAGKPECVETGNAPAGMICGSGMVCKGGTCSSCAAGDPCAPANPCHEGSLDCTGGIPKCNETNKPLSAGADCGPDNVCSSDGRCVACKPGAPCESKDPCKVGKIDCTSGSPTCVDGGNAANGKACGMGKVCNAGMCVTCSGGMMCTPSNKCHAGTLSCAAGVADCADTNKNAANGTSCGSGLVCSNGDCVPCTPDVSCTTGNPCKTGSTSCAAGTSQCVESGNARNGKACGDGKVCRDGGCVACNEGDPCMPSSPCRTGTLSCSTGMPLCMEGMPVPNGTSCGASQVCSGGSCVACKSGNPCAPAGNPCRLGKTSCASGTQVCIDGGSMPNGAVCGTNMVCNSGACVTCTSGVSCTPPGNACKTGNTVCSSGTSACSETGNVGDGTPCGANLVCHAGGCVACAAGSMCTPGTNPCHLGALSCATGQPVCNDTGALLSDGASCGTQKVCSSGICLRLLKVQCQPIGSLSGTFDLIDGNPNGAHMTEIKAGQQVIDEFGTTRFSEGFASFDCSAIPAGASVVDAQLKLFMTQEALFYTGDAGRASARIDHVVFDSFSADVVSMAALDTPGSLVPETGTHEYKTVGVKASVAADLNQGRNRSQFRVVSVQTNPFLANEFIILSPPGMANPPMLEATVRAP